MQVVKTGEMAIAAMAAKAKAEVEARYVIALRPENRRDINVTRATILDSCKRLKFAQGARYKKPVGGSTIVGFSIRFAEEAIKAMKNISTDSMIVWEDDEKRNIRVTVSDLESNTTYADDVIVQKTVERKQLKTGQEKLGERLNSYGEKVFLVAATEDDMANKVNSAKSKIIRNNGLRLLPQDILEEALEQINATLADPKNAGDPKAETKKICDGFNEFNINPAELARYLGHSVDTISPAELTELRAIYTAIKDGETSWAATLEAKGITGNKGPSQSGPVDPGEVSKGIDAGAIEKPYEHLQGLCKEHSVTESQVHQFMKSQKLAGEKTEELPQATDANMRAVIRTFKDVLPKIKKFPAQVA
jgi:hypothetical protein